MLDERITFLAQALILAKGKYDNRVFSFSYFRGAVHVYFFVVRVLRKRKENKMCIN